MEERSWLVPSIALTALMIGSALLLMPDNSGIMPALGLLPLWLIMSGALACLAGFIGMVATGVKSPIAHILTSARTRWRHHALVALGITVAGLNMCAFMWVKPLLNYYVPFRADPALAALDRLMFLGADPGYLFDGLNSLAMALFYHRGWFAMMVMTLLVVLTRAPSPQRSAVLLTYFMLWSVAGPLIHLAVPAAGPVFYQRLGYGDAFAALSLPDEVLKVADFLWQSYQAGEFTPGSGISAMPSLHIATCAWMVLAMWVLARQWTAAIAVLCSLIFVLSVSLGWHYVSDGLVGAAAAVLTYRACLWFYLGRYRIPAVQQAEPTPALN